jgi:hypothetical protein
VTRQFGVAHGWEANAERLLNNGNVVGMFVDRDPARGAPTVEHGLGREGFARLCARTGAPLVACSIYTVGGHAPTGNRLETALRILPARWLPGTLGLGRLAPACTIRIAFDEPICLEGPTPGVDSLVVAKLAARVHARLKSLDDETAEGTRWIR